MTSHVVRVKVVLDFVGVLPVGGNHSSPEDAAKRLFRMMDVGITGFVCTEKKFLVTSKEVELPNEPTV